MNIITSYVCIYTVCIYIYIYICIYNIYRVFYFSSFSFRHFPVPSGVSQAVNFEVAAIGSTLNTATFVGSFWPATHLDDGKTGSFMVILVIFIATVRQAPVA